MQPSPPANILVLAARPDAAARWAAALEADGHRVWLSPNERPERAPLDLVLTDQPHHEPGPWLPGEAAGVVRLGVPGPCDVLLPRDFTLRELRLACQLLAEMVRLRRGQRRAAEQVRELEHEALTDPLTRLPNRRAWDQALAGLGGAGSPGLCVAVLDLDHFKQVNDIYGHGTGDEVLRTAGNALREGLRQGDLVARLGGDEFGLLLALAGKSEALAVVDRARRAIPAALAQDSLPSVTASAGCHLICPLPAGEGLGVRVDGPGAHTQSSRPHPDPLPKGEGTSASPPNPLAAADAALLAAKRSGRDRTVMA